MEAFLVAAWLVVAALLLGPPLLGVNRSTWPLEDASTASATENESRSTSTDPAPTDSTSTAPASTDPVPTEFAPTPVGRCRACGEDGQENYTYCRACLTPLPRPEEGAEPERESGHPAD